jgi:hypothetical protein
VQLQVTDLPPITRITSLVLRRRDPLRLPAVDNFVRLILDRYRKEPETEESSEKRPAMDNYSDGHKNASLAAGDNKGGEELRHSQRRSRSKAEA